MLARIGYDGHPSGWCVVLTAESEAEAAALASWVAATQNGAVLKIGHAANDFTCPDNVQRSRIFRLERLDKKDDGERVGFQAPRLPLEVGPAEPVAGG